MLFKNFYRKNHNKHRSFNWHFIFCDVTMRP